jgi:branched-chain amino acid transport system ATP-binding protein
MVEAKMVEAKMAPASAASTAANKVLLSVKNLQSWYGESHILHGVNLEVRQGEVVCLLGRNGAGKTTTLKSIMGVVRKREGSITRDTTETIKMMPERIAKLGIAFCPEERAIFSSLTVRENLMLPPKLRDGGMSVEEIFTLFPNLKERIGTSQGTKLSGGEQQMLAMARILRTGADMLLLDEVTEGLAPVIIQQIGATIRKLKERGLTILLVEQNFRFASTVADRFYVMDHGVIVDGFNAADLEANMPKLHEYLGV